MHGGDWQAALSANEESAEIVADKTYSQGEFLDGAALAPRSWAVKIFLNALKRRGVKLQACCGFDGGSVHSKARVP
jgi:hypothetical protein